MLLLLSCLSLMTQRILGIIYRSLESKELYQFIKPVERSWVETPASQFVFQ